MKDLGIPRGHALKMRRKLRERLQVRPAADAIGEEEPQEAVAQLWLQAAKADPTPPQPQPQPRPAPSARFGCGDTGGTAPAGEMKTAVERSWEQVAVLGPAAVGQALYRHTFILAPEAMGLFPYHVRAKYMDWSDPDDENDLMNAPSLRILFSKIINTVGCAVSGLHDPKALVPMLLQLGGRHIGYGTVPEHWEVVGQALQLTLRDALQDDYTPEVEAAWSMMYTFLSQLIIEGLRKAIAARDASFPGAVCDIDADVDRGGSSATCSRSTSAATTAATVAAGGGGAVAVAA